MLMRILAIGLGSIGVLSATSLSAAAASNAQTTVAEQRPRIAYTAFHVLDVDRSLKFYIELLGMKERQRIPLDNGRTEILIGYGDPNGDAGILLFHDKNRTQPYTHGDGYHRLILDVKDLPGLIAHLKDNGVKVTREPTRVDNLKLSYAFIADPDGYALELVESD